MPKSEKEQTKDKHQTKELIIFPKAVTLMQIKSNQRYDETTIDEKIIIIKVGKGQNNEHNIMH